MTPVEVPVEKWQGAVREVTLGAAGDGGTRTSTVTVGGEATLPFLHFEGAMPHHPAVAAEVTDVYPEDWSPVLLETLGVAARDPAAWAKAAVDGRRRADRAQAAQRAPGARRCRRRHLRGHRQGRARRRRRAAHRLRSRGQAEKDNEVLVAVAEATKGERLVLANCEEKNYRTIVAAALGNGHLVVGQTPIDVNLAKQLNILISDMGLSLDRALMDPNTGALGYGVEYTYSVMERLRLAALMGDTMTQQPMICTVGEEAWRQKEARAAEGVPRPGGSSPRAASRGR